MLNGSGGYIKINGGDIGDWDSGAASFKASMKELAGASASASGPALKAAAIRGCPSAGETQQLREPARCDSPRYVMGCRRVH